MRLPLALLPAALLCLTLLGLPAPAGAQALGAVNTAREPQTTLDAEPPERGWQGLAKALDSLKPGVDTRMQPTPAQYTDYIEQKINAGELNEALRVIQEREAALRGKPYTDAQLLFQRARVFAALGRTDEAIAAYTDLTTRFPELPEPWNNLAALQAQRGNLAQARVALTSALRNHPDYADASKNLQLLDAMSAHAAASSDSSAGPSSNSSSHSQAQ